MRPRLLVGPELRETVSMTSNARSAVTSLSALMSRLVLLIRLAADIRCIATRRGAMNGAAKRLLRNRNTYKLEMSDCHHDRAAHRILCMQCGFRATSSRCGKMESPLNDFAHLWRSTDFSPHIRPAMSDCRHQVPVAFAVTCPGKVRCDDNSIRRVAIPLLEQTFIGLCLLA
jgi:hypothetical protein